MSTLLEAAPVVALVLVSAATTVACQPKAYDQLEQRCDDLGGQVVDYGPSGFDCLVDGKFLGLQVPA
ncbi:hypothetical protein [Solicola sp. PLA-1-18]|uniref:hypothetical protein n=1 Tax=Solicola sp. PLA-1-18 TaxID=3380532 RepID=UPI003B7FBE9B